MALASGHPPEPGAYFGGVSFAWLFFAAPDQSSKGGGRPTEPEGHFQSACWPYSECVVSGRLEFCS